MSVCVAELLACFASLVVVRGGAFAVWHLCRCVLAAALGASVAVVAVEVGLLAHTQLFCD